METTVAIELTDVQLLLVETHFYIGTVELLTIEVQ